MKNKILFILSVLFAANVVYSEYQYCPVSNKDSGYIHNGPLMPRCTENDSPEIWSGSWEDLKAISALVRDKFPFELTKHLGRDIAALKPATLEEMKLGKEKGYLNNWEEYPWDAYHEPSNIIDEFVKFFPESEDLMQKVNDIVKVIGGKVSKYTTQSGDEVVYNKKDGKIILDEKLGTKNLGDNYKWVRVFVEEVTEEIKRKGVLPSWFPSEMIGRVVQWYLEYPSHKKVDIVPHEKNNQYKYAGILFESDSDGRFYIVDGQTGKRMTKKQVEDFPTTFSDMWKDKGLVCVESDAIDIVPPKENRQSAQNASSEDGNGGVKGVVAKTDADEAKDSNDKRKPPESITVEAKDDGVDIPTLDMRIQGVIKAITLLSSCMKEHNAAIDLVLRSQPKRAMNDVKGIIADSHAVSAERKKYEKRIKECILSLNVSFLEMEKEFEDDSVGKLGEARRNTYNTVKPHIIKLFEILRDSPDVIRDIVEQVIPIQFARFLVNNDNKIRKKYLLKSTFGVDFDSYLK